MSKIRYSKELSQYTKNPYSLKQATLDIFDALVPQKGLNETLKIIYNEKNEGGGFRRAARTLIELRPNEMKPFFDNLGFEPNEDVVQWHFAGILGKCKICGKPTTNNKTYCSRECYFSDSEPHEKRKQTCLERFGVEYSGSAKSLREHRKQTLLKRYGVTETFSDPEITRKAQETQRKKYDGKLFIQSEYGKNKLKQSVIEKYGVDNYAKTDEFKAKYQNTCIEKYGVPYPMQSQICMENHKKTNMEKYGVPWSSQSEQYLRKHYQELLESNFPEVELKENDKILDVLKNLITKKYVSGGLFDAVQMAHDFKIGRDDTCRLKHRLGITNPNVPFATSIVEKDLFDFISDSSKRPNDRTLIPPLELDIVIPNKNLAIEYDGIYWHCELHRDKNYHLSKTLACREKGYQLLHIFESDDIDIWKSVINNKLGLSHKIYARKCVIKEIDAQTCAQFLFENHLQGNTPAKVKLGLFYQDELVQVMTFSKPRFNKHYEYELIRMCSKLNTTVVGGASKLFKYFIKIYNPKSIISYANLRWSDGGIYEKLGFKYTHTSNPNYWYTDGHDMIPRNDCYKSKLKRFESYSDDKTEYQIMNEEGFFRIFDCGNLVYEWKSDSKPN